MTDAIDINQSIDEEVTYCAVHPERETGLRCNKCDRLMCVECARQTPVGYRCRECVRQHDDTFFNIENADYIKVAGVGFGMALVAGFVVNFIGWPLIALIIGLPTGAAIAGVAMRVIENRRGRETMYYATGAAVVGGFIGSILSAYFDYPELWSQANDVASQLGVESPYPSVTSFMFEHGVTDFTVLLFVGLMAVAIYGRLKV